MQTGVEKRVPFMPPRRTTSGKAQLSVSFSKMRYRIGLLLPETNEGSY